MKRLLRCKQRKARASVVLFHIGRPTSSFHLIIWLGNRKGTKLLPLYGRPAKLFLLLFLFLQRKAKRWNIFIYLLLDDDVRHRHGPRLFRLGGGGSVRFGLLSIKIRFSRVGVEREIISLFATPPRPTWMDNKTRAFTRESENSQQDKDEWLRNFFVRSVASKRRRRNSQNKSDRCQGAFLIYSRVPSSCLSYSLLTNSRDNSAD